MKYAYGQIFFYPASGMPGMSGMSGYEWYVWHARREEHVRHSSLEIMGRSRSPKANTWMKYVHGCARFPDYLKEYL